MFRHVHNNCQLKTSSMYQKLINVWTKIECIEKHLANNTTCYGWKVAGNINNMSMFYMQPSICHVWKTNGDIWNVVFTNVWIMYCYFLYINNYLTIPINIEMWQPLLVHGFWKKIPPLLCLGMYENFQLKSF
jgi:hypothetical protein